MTKQPRKEIMQKSKQQRKFNKLRSQKARKKIAQKQKETLPS